MPEFRDILEAELGKVKDLPTLPDIVLRLETALNSEETAAEDVANIIVEDPVLAGQVLRVTNSAFFGPTRGEITSVRDAVARLGFTEIRRLCTTLSMIQTTSGIGADLDHKQFWNHSVVAAVSTGVLSDFSHSSAGVARDEAYLAGLLHDIGVLILDQYFASAFARVRKFGDEKGISYDEAERHVLKMDHGEVGGYLLDLWGLPAAIVEAVRWHHQPGRAQPEHQNLVYTVHLAEFVCTCLGVGDGGDGTTYGFSESAWHDLGLSVDDIPAIIDEVKAQVDRCSTLVSLS